jgi:glycosyltransferase involved in cell wall biosynthesis
VTETNERAPRVLMLLHAHFPDEPRVAAEVGAAVAAGFDVDVVALRRPGEGAEAEVEGARLIRLPVEHRRGVGVASLVKEYLVFTALATVEAARRARRRRYDVVQVHNPPDFLMVAAVVPRLLGARVIFDVHDLSPDMFAMRFDNAPSGLRHRVLLLVERLAATFANEVLTVHEPYRQELASRGISERKITVVMNSLDERLMPAAPRVEERNGFRVVYHGTVTPHYGVGLVVEAAAEVRRRHPTLTVDVYGEGDAVPTIEARARQLGLDGVVHLHPALPQGEVLRAVQSASVGVVPNLPTRLNRFALSTKLLEYVALGIPVVSADLPTIRSHFSDDEVLFFEAGDAESLARALDTVASDPAAAARRAAAARSRYEAYRWEHNATTYVDLLRRCARR